MKTVSKIVILLVSATLAGAAFARGPGGGQGGGMGGGQGQMAGSGPKYGQSGSQGQGTRTQTRDPAANSTGQPIQQRDRIHTPGAGIAPTVPVTTN
jgi:hypothetical protein